MPRTSLKAKLTCELQDLWFSNTILGFFFNSHDLSIIFEVLLGELEQRKNFTVQISPPLKNHSPTEQLLFCVYNLGSFEQVGRNKVRLDESGEEGLKEDIMEGVELLGLGISAVRYLSPRDPNHAIHDDRIFQSNSNNAQISPITHLATTLYVLGSYDISTVRGAAQLRLGEGTTHLHTNHCIMALVRLLPQFVQWPTPVGVQYGQMQREIEDQSGFPGSVGFLDGTNIVLQ
ncbi:hypothetical protein HOY80DRAFT_1076791 [Tuber brumale]|nr:hypothetical protein HOY80DRAFT_1076791 [Tuber brumale]